MAVQSETRVLPGVGEKVTYPKHGFKLFIRSAKGIKSVATGCWLVLPCVREGLCDSFSASMCCLAGQPWSFWTVVEQDYFSSHHQWLNLNGCIRFMARNARPFLLNKSKLLNLSTLSIQAETCSPAQIASFCQPGHKTQQSTTPKRSSTKTSRYLVKFTSLLIKQFITFVYFDSICLRFPPAWLF